MDDLHSHFGCPTKAYSRKKKDNIKDVGAVGKPSSVQYSAKLAFSVQLNVYTVYVSES